MNDLTDTTIITSTQPSAPCQVLIVDDDELVQEQLASLLSHAGYRVARATSGEEALRVIERQPCSIVISDWEMPEMDGIALTRNLRQRQQEGYVYVLLLTVRRSKRDVVAGLQAGADDYIPKGASPEEILARLETARRIITLEQSLRAANRENRRLAVTDALTGARNRRYLMKFLPREYARSKRYGRPIAVLACDIDRFKLINDGFGHECGDEVLREVVARIGRSLRDCDWVARSGGEEFVAVLPETDLDGAKRVAERVRLAVSSAPIATAAGPLSSSISLGAAAIQLPHELEQLDYAALLRVADKCMYASKSAGRNRVTAMAVSDDKPRPTGLAARGAAGGTTTDRNELTLMEEDTPGKGSKHSVRGVVRWDRNSH